MPINWKTLLGFGSGVVAHEAAEQVLQSIFKTVGEKGTDFLKSSVLGLGTNDESLFRSAASYAMLKLNVDPKEIHRVVKVIGTLPFSSRSRVIQIIGKDEAEVVIKTPVLDPATQQPITDKKGNVVNREEKIRMNIRGGQALAYFSKLTDQQIIDELHASNMTSHLAEHVDTIKTSATAIFDDLGNGMSSGNTLLDRWADGFR